MKIEETTREIGAMSESVKRLEKSMDVLRTDIKEDIELIRTDVRDLRVEMREGFDDIKNNHLKSIYKKLESRVSQTTAILMVALCSLAVGLIVFVVTN